MKSERMEKVEKISKEIMKSEFEESHACCARADNMALTLLVSNKLHGLESNRNKVFLHRNYNSSCKFLSFL